MAIYGQIFDALLTSQRAGGTTLSGGKAYFYSPGTTTLKTVYADRSKATPAANPYTLSSDGTAMLYGDGLYDIKITTAGDVQKYLWEDVALQDASGEFYTLTNYADLATAITTIGSTKVTLLIPSNITIDSVTIPATMTLKPINGAIITVNTGETLTFAAQPDLPLDRQCFSGAGSVTGLKEARPEWFATNTTPGVTDMSAAIEKAIASTTGTVYGTRSTSYGVVNVDVATSVTIKDMVLVGLDATAELQAPLNITADNVTIDHVKITEKASEFSITSNLPCLYATGVDNLVITNSEFIGGKSNATSDFGSVHIDTSTNVRITNNKVFQSEFEGINLTDCTDCVVANNSLLDCTNSGIATVNGQRIVVSGNSVNYVDTANYLGASGLSINSLYTTVSGNTINNAYLNGITLGHTIGGDANDQKADHSVISGNTITLYGRRDSADNGGIVIDNALHVTVSDNIIGPSIDNTASSKYNTAILFSNTTTNSAIATVSSNRIDTPYGYGIYATALPDAAATIPSEVIISNNSIRSAWLSGVYATKGNILRIDGNIIYLANRANNANHNGISYIYSVTDPTTLDISRNTIVDTTPYQRYGVLLSSVSATTVVTMHGNKIRGWVTAPYPTGTTSLVDSRGNDYDGTARAAVQTMTTSATSTTVTCTQAYTKERVLISGRASAQTMIFAVGTITSGTSFVVNHTAAVAGSSFEWMIL